MTRIPVLLFALTALACGATNGSDGVDGGTGGGDAAPSCEMVISVLTPQPLTGATVDVDGSIDTYGTSGFQEFDFTVTLNNIDVVTSERTPFDGSKISFVANQPGPYRVELRGRAGGLSCTDDVATVNVSDPGVATRPFRFRFAPALGQAAPPQDKLFEIPGAADYSLGTVSLDPGLSVSGTVTEGANPVAAYLRFTSTTDGSAVEAFADDAGAYATRLVPGSYTSLVVPEDGALAPAGQPADTAVNLGDFQLPAADAISGTVTDGGGQPVAGVEVALRIDGVPSTIATTDASGDFTVLGRAGGATSIHVEPPAATGLPRLELPASAGLVASPAESLAIAYAAGLTSRTVDLTVSETDGTTAAPGAQVTFALRDTAAAATVTPQGGSPLDATGTGRVTVTADGAGQLQAELPEGTYDVIVRPPAGSGQTIHVAPIDLSAGQPALTALTLAEPAELTGRVLDSTGAGIEGARILAWPRGLLANETAGSSMTYTGADGSYSLPVVGRAAYEVLVDPPADWARAMLADVVAPAPGASGALGDTAPERAIRVSGRVSLPGAPSAAGVTVQVFCGDCTGTAARTPLAETVTGAQGVFELPLPDPEITANP